MTSKAILSAEAKLKQQRKVLINAEEKIKQSQSKAHFDNANNAPVETFAKKSQEEREIIDERIGELKQQLHQLQDAKEQECYSSFPQEIHHRLVKKWAQCDCPPNDTFGGMEIPKNIEHAFRTQQVQELMSDPSRVNASIAENQADLQRQRKTELLAKLKPSEVVKIPGGDAIYYELSGALRSNTFPGYAWDQTYGVEKSTYTNDVFKKAAEQAPRPDSQEAKNMEQFRYKADDFTRWRESFFIREQQAKKWTTVQGDKKGGNK